MFIGTEKRVFLFQIRTPVVAGNVVSMDVALSSMILCELPQSWQVLKKRKTNVASGSELCIALLVVAFSDTFILCSGIRNQLFCFEGKGMT